MITYNSDNALIFTIPHEEGCSIPNLSNVQSYSFGGYGSGISTTGVHFGANSVNTPGVL